MMSSMNGCFSSKQKPYTLKADMLKFVNEKYDMEFVPTYFAMDDSVAQLVVYPKGGDREKDNFIVDWNKNESTGKYEYTDSYSAIMMAPKYKEKIEELLKHYFENYSVEVRADMCVLPNDFGVYDDFQKVLDRRIEYTPHVFIKVAHSSDSIDDFNNKLDKLVDDIADNFINGEILFFYLKGTDLSVDTQDDNNNDVRKYIRFTGVGEKYHINKH
ncbi:MAG TPA: hypothetical protein DG753_12110 [Clostridium sp.]|nr:hypothetical protein [Clostridium sp.]